jgi:hypothetical protein
VTVATLNRESDGFARHSVETATVPGLTSKAEPTASALYQERVKFALGWARWEPALVAQHYREWFDC